MSDSRPGGGAPAKRMGAAVGRYIESAQQCHLIGDANVNPMPFDGKRLIFGGFEVLVEA